MKLELLTNATVVSDAVKFVSEHNNNAEPSSVSLTEVEDHVVSNHQQQEVKEESTTNQIF